MKILLFLFLLSIASCDNTHIINKDADTKTPEEYSDKGSHISKEECRKLREYCISKGFNENVCVLVDFSEYSGNERLYIYNLNKNYIEYSGRVAHGIGKNGMSFNASFSNEPESWLSSLGNYKIGKLRTLNIPRFNDVPLP